MQHFCLHDGPGVRSLVFFKGCPLRCSWCQNPESWRRRPQLGFKAHLCIGCGGCVAVCPAGARTGAGGLPERGACRRCFACVDNCPAGALVRFGDQESVDSLLEKLRPEFPLYRESGGGVTLSGGEPTMAAEFAAALAGRLRAEKIHVAIETCGQFTVTERGDDPVRQLLSAVDLVLFDIKLFEDDEHRRHCGGGSPQQIRSNLAAMAEQASAGTGPELMVRLPLVAGVTTTESNLASWGSLLRELGLSRLVLVPYHAMGAGKRSWIGAAASPDFTPVDDELRERTRRILAASGVAAELAGT